MAKLKNDSPAATATLDAPGSIASPWPASMRGPLPPPPAPRIPEVADTVYLIDVFTEFNHAAIPVERTKFHAVTVSRVNTEVHDPHPILDVEWKYTDTYRRVKMAELRRLNRPEHCNRLWWRLDEDGFLADAPRQFAELPAVGDVVALFVQDDSGYVKMHSARVIATKEMTEGHLDGATIESGDWMEWLDLEVDRTERVNGVRFAEGPRANRCWVWSVPADEPTPEKE